MAAQIFNVLLKSSQATRCYLKPNLHNLFDITYLVKCGVYGLGNSVSKYTGTVLLEALKVKQLIQKRSYGCVFLLCFIYLFFSQYQI